MTKAAMPDLLQGSLKSESWSLMGDIITHHPVLKEEPKSEKLKLFWAAWQKPQCQTDTQVERLIVQWKVKVKFTLKLRVKGEAVSLHIVLY